MKFTLVLLFLLIARVSNAQSEGLFHLVIGSYGVAAFTDTSLTQYGLGKDIVHEANPLQKWFTDKGPLVSGIAKGTEHVAIGYLLLKYHKSENSRTKKIILASALALTAFQVWVDYSNYKVINNANK